MNLGEPFLVLGPERDPKLLVCAARGNFFMLWRGSLPSGNPMAEPTEIDWPQQLQYLRELARIVRDEKLTRLEIESEGHKWTLKAAPTVVAQSVVVTANSVSAPIPASPAVPDLVPLASPMVGVFYHAPAPGEPNFAEIGDRIERGQTIGLIEAMKVFNEITAEASGTLVEIPAGNGQLVETGMPLMLLKP